jgi:hypothetical protein
MESSFQTGAVFYERLPILKFSHIVLSRLFLIDFLHICAKAALITIPADKAMPGIGTAFTSLEQSTNGTFLPHRRIFRCRQGLTPASVIYMLHCDFLSECKKAPESS